MRSREYFLFASLISLLGLGTAKWQDIIQPQTIVYDDASPTFAIDDDEPTLFRKVLVDGDYILVGGKNSVHNLSLPDLTESRTLTWHPEENDVTLCDTKGMERKKCQNYIRVMVKTASNDLLVCGTNAYKPLCRKYSVNDEQYDIRSEESGVGICPYDPYINNTFVYVDEQLYTGTSSDFHSISPIIYRNPLKTLDNVFIAPNFVSSMTHGDYVYFFFREIAEETNVNDRVVYSRVARLCKNDKGRGYMPQWTSFVKSRLNCSVPGDFPAYFNEIQSTTSPVSGNHQSHSVDLIYGVFTTPDNSISGSAICAFSLQAINDVFDRQDNCGEGARPGQCVDDSRKLKAYNVAWNRKRYLSKSPIPAFFSNPLIVYAGAEYRYTALAVDQVVTVDGKAYDVLFIGTTAGAVIKAINLKSAESIEETAPLIIEEIRVFNQSTPVRDVKIVRAKNESEHRMIVVSDHQVKSLHLHRCTSKNVKTCEDCVALRDPYCAWDKTNEKCSSLDHLTADKISSHFVQDVVTGKHEYCTATASSR